MRGPLAQHEMSESLSPDLVSVLILCDVDLLGRSGLGEDAAIRRMHTNLAHASVPDMRRMLMAARAPQPILDALARFSCAQCDAMTAPTIPRGVGAADSGPTQVRGHGRQVERTRASRASTLLTRRATCNTFYQFFETETSEVLLRQYRQRTRAYGRPRWLQVDASRPNLGETLQRALEADGTQLLDVPGEAHEQVGRVEVHGRYSENMLARLRFGQTLRPSGSNASTRPWKPRTSHKKVRLQPFPDSLWP